MWPVWSIGRRSDNCLINVERDGRVNAAKRRAGRTGAIASALRPFRPVLIASVDTPQALVRDELRTRTLLAWLMAGLAGLALALASVSTLGLVMADMEQRVRNLQ